MYILYIDSSHGHKIVPVIIPTIATGHQLQFIVYYHHPRYHWSWIWMILSFSVSYMSLKIKYLLIPRFQVIIWYLWEQRFCVIVLTCTVETKCDGTYLYHEQKEKGSVILQAFYCSVERTTCHKTKFVVA